MAIDRNLIDAEADRLASKGLLEAGYTEESLLLLAQKTLSIKALAREKNAVIAAHVYQRLEIIHGIADFTGDSYRLSKLCCESPASTIVFCGVRFMAETAKIMNPQKTVILPAEEAGCSLAESIQAEDVRQLRKAHPGVPVITYINTNADIKAESDIIVTSSSAPAVVADYFKRYDKIIFLPDKLMGLNLAREVDATAVMADGQTVHTGSSGKQMILWNGTCMVHDQFDENWVKDYRQRYPGLKILAHTECSPSLVSLVDFAGSTTQMLDFIDKNQAPSYMLVTECGLGDLARSKHPDKTFVPMCRLCPHMKATILDRVEKSLRNPNPENIITVAEEIRVRAARALYAGIK